MGKGILRDCNTAYLNVRKISIVRFDCLELQNIHDVYRHSKAKLYSINAKQI